MRLWCAVLLGASLTLAERAALADDDDRTAAIPESSIAHTLPNSGDPGGIRKSAGERGITYGAIYTGEVLSNVAGGIRRGTIYEGKLENYLNINFEKLTGWKGLNFYVNTFQIHGTGGLRRDYVGNLITISNIEALPSTRLSELWLEQKFFGGAAGLRIGQLAADSEFFFSSYSNLFINTDWPTITAANLPSGGPAYPLSTPGIRLKLEPTSDLSLLFAIFNGDPAGPGPGDEQRRNSTGLNFRVNDPPFLMAETQFRYNQGKADTGLAGALKLGAWAHLGRFDDQRFGTDGLSLAAPTSNGIARRLPGNFGLYGVIDQQIYRPAGGDANSGVAVFSRVSASPSDRNLINFYIDGGITFAGFVPGRPNDKFGAIVTVARISDSARAFDRDVLAYTGGPCPVRNFEATLELAYQAQIVPGWTVQPVFQYVVHPGGRVLDPLSPASAPIKDATVVGLRSTIRY